MEGWTAERVQQLAPDAASAKAGVGLSAPRHWTSTGADGNLLWGECQGSGAKPYQVRVDASEPAFKCSCPSRKFPCKHALGLMLMSVSGAVKPAARPAWVEEWLADRANRAEKKREKVDAPSKSVDAAAQQKRKESRLERIDSGLAALKLWLHDLVRTGIASVPSRGYAFFDDQARRLIDAQAPGAARRVQILGGTASSGAGWQRGFLEQLALLHLLVRGFERRDKLPESARDVVLNVVGVPRPQEEVLALPPVADRWQVIAQEVTVEGPLRAQHTWLLAEHGGVLVRILAFAHGAQPFDMTLPPGFAFDGEICLYPGDPLRGVVKSKRESSPLTAIAHAGPIDGLYDRYATQRALNPWLEGLAVPLAAVVPAKSGDGWTVSDARSHALPLTVDDAGAWTLMAVSGGNPVDLVVHFDGRRARPLAVLTGGQYLRLDAGREAVQA